MDYQTDNRGAEHIEGTRTSRPCSIPTAPRFISRKRRERLERRREALKKYGLTPESYAQMSRDQHGRCLICGRPETGKTKDLFVDHDHRSNEVRGLLCGRCNAALGLFRDDPEIIANACQYLSGWYWAKASKSGRRPRKIDIKTYECFRLKLYRKRSRKRKARAL